MQLFQELRRRNVIRVAVAYVVTAWLLLQVADLVLDAIGAPAWVLQSFLLLAAIGLVPTLLFAWAFELTPEGIKREEDVDRSQSITPQTGRKLDYAIFGLLAVVALYFFWESRFRGETAATTSQASATQTSREANGPESFSYDSTNSIAVLPFVNLSSDPEQEYFSDGISEELLNVLAQYPGLRVAARTSSFQFKGDNRDISEIAQQLRVSHVIEGSVRKAGNRLRITAQLIEASGGYHLWSETYDRELDDIFAVQDEISSAIGEALRTELKLPRISNAIPRVVEAANTASYEAYLRGRHLINQRGNKAITEAVRHLETSIRLDKNFAPARAQVAIAYSLLSNSAYGNLTTSEVNVKAAPHVERAFNLNPHLAETWGAKCKLADANEKYEQVLEYCERALEINPSYVDALNWLKNAAFKTHQYRLVEHYIRLMYDSDPLSVVGRVNYVLLLGITDPAEAHRIADELVRSYPWAGYVAHGSVSSAQGDMAQTLRWSLLAFRENPLDYDSNLYPAWVFRQVNLVDEAERFSEGTRPDIAVSIEDFVEVLPQVKGTADADPGNSFLMLKLAYVAYYAGDYELALGEYRRLHEGRSTALPTANSEAHSTLRYALLLRREGEEAEAQRWLAAVEQNLQTKRGTVFSLVGEFLRDLIFLTWMRGEPDQALTLMADAPPHLLAPRNELLDPAMESLREDPRYVAQVARFDAWVAEQRAEVLDLICNRNPIPNAWQPLEETCSEAKVTAAL